jgi:mannosyltransferase OCH1-like enzyme
MEKKIPKIIHYCWFSGEPLNNQVKRNIRSWKKYCPNYEIKQWNATNFDMEINDFVKEAYEAKKWAFVTDFARLYILYHYGGIYMDSDVEVTKNLDRFLKTPGFMGHETKTSISAGVIGARKGNPCIKTFLDYYRGKHFKNQNGSFNQVTNVKIMTRNLAETYQVYLNGKFQRVKNYMAIYPQEFFSPKDYSSGSIFVTSKTYAIHHFNGSWIAEQEKNRHKLKQVCTRFFGNAVTETFFN